VSRDGRDRADSIGETGSCVLSEAERRSDNDRYSEWKVLGITIVHLGTLNKCRA
jgi:hypothetical protein